MRTVRVLATGGTIASRADTGGAAVASDTGTDLVARLRLSADIRVDVDDVFTVGGYLMTLERMHELAIRARDHLRDPDLAGLVVTHGTDTIEETALFLDLFAADSRPIVFTGAQRPADAGDTDGPRNLSDAITVAADPASRGLGALVVFDGSIFAARGTRKSQTIASDTFAAPDGAAVGWVHGDGVHVENRPRRREPLDLDTFDLTGVRVDIAACYPGADAAALRAFAAAGANGIVLQATGAGNANLAICEAVAELSAAGIVVATSTRVWAGPVAAIYGNGGGVDLFQAGAVPTGLLRPSQARIVLAALLGVHRDPGAVRAALRSQATG